MTKLSTATGTHRTSGAAVEAHAPGSDAAKPATAKFREVRGGAARGISGSLVDYGPQTKLMMSLSSAITSATPPWPELREQVLSSLPAEPGSLELSFKKAFEQAETSASALGAPGSAPGAPGSPDYISALKQLKTAFTMMRILQMT